MLRTTPAPAIAAARAADGAPAGLRGAISIIDSGMTSSSTQREDHQRLRQP